MRGEAVGVTRSVWVTEFNLHVRTTHGTSLPSSALTSVVKGSDGKSRPCQDGRFIKSLTEMIDSGPRHKVFEPTSIPNLQLFPSQTLMRRLLFFLDDDEAAGTSRSGRASGRGPAGEDALGPHR